MINVLLIGCGNIAHHYAYLFKEKDISFAVHGRSFENTREFSAQYSVNFTCEGKAEFPQLSNFSHVVLAAPIEVLAKYVELLCSYKSLHILCEKPGFLKWEELQGYLDKDNLWFAFNRRFYNVAQTLKDLIRQSSFLKVQVAFDERICQVEKSKKSNNVKKHWMLANSSHVIDLALYLLNYKVGLEKFNYDRRGGLSWHPSGQFFHASYLDNKTHLTFDSSWNGFGGWSISVSNEDSDFALKPLEKLTVVQEAGVREYSEEGQFKAGFEGMLTSFLGDKSGLMTPNELDLLANIIFDLAGYDRK